MNAGILALLGTPYLLLGVIGGLIYRAVRRAQPAPPGGPPEVTTPAPDPEP